MIELEVPEGEQIEYKETLPAKGPEGDPWTNGSGSMGDRAKTAILEEVVAFSNAHGGAAFLNADVRQIRIACTAQLLIENGDRIMACPIEQIRHFRGEVFV